MKLKIFIASILLLSLSSCGLMEEDRTFCPMGLYVGLRYDYNLYGDVFKDQVGSVSMYVTDSLGVIVATRTVSNDSNSKPWGEYGHKESFSELPVGRYKIYAIGRSRSFESISSEKGSDKFVTSEPGIGDNISSLSVELTRSSEKESVSFTDRGRSRTVSGHLVRQDRDGLDTLWHTLSETEAEVRYMKPTYAEVPLVRDMKRVSITLRQIPEKDKISSEDFEVFITSPTGKMDYENKVMEDDTLLYRPFFSVTDEYEADGEVRSESVLYHAAHYDFTMSRILYEGKSGEKDAVLYVVGKKNRELIGALNLGAYLSYGRDAFSRRYPYQEYLDRESEYNIDIIISGNRLAYMVIRVGILKWSKRIQLSDLS